MSRLTVIVPGSRVRYQREGQEREGTVESISACLRRGDKFGQGVQELAWRDRETAFLLLDTGYCYGFELV